MNVNFTFIFRIYDALICGCVLKFSDATIMFEHKLPEKVKARTTNWYIYLRIGKKHPCIIKRYVQISRKYNKV